jgi:hypothetical protein
MHNAYLRLDIERTLAFTNTSGAAVAPNHELFIGDKHAANVIKKFRIYCNDTLITDSLDFV